MVYSALTRFDRSKFDITVCFWRSEGSLSEMYRLQGIKVFHVANGLPLGRIWRLWKLLVRNRFDIIEIYGLRINVIGRLLGWLTGHRRIVTLQRSVDDWRRRRHVLLDHLTSLWVTLYISNTQAGADRLQAREKVHASKLRVITNGVNVAAFDQSRSSLVKAELGIDHSKLVITCVANFRDAKGHHTLLDAVAAVRRQNPDFCLWLVGDGPLRPDIEGQIRSLRLGGVVKVLGQRSDIPRILANTDIFVLASLWEGMPNAILEAMAARLPVVATCVGGIPEIVVDKEMGYLVPPKDPTALAEALIRMLENKSLRQEMGNAGHRRVCSRFSLDAKVRQLERTYLALVHPSRGGVLTQQ